MKCPGLARWRTQPSGLSKGHRGRGSTLHRCCWNCGGLHARARPECGLGGLTCRFWPHCGKWEGPSPRTGTRKRCGGGQGRGGQMHSGGRRTEVRKTATADIKQLRIEMQGFRDHRGSKLQPGIHEGIWGLKAQEDFNANRVGRSRPSPVGSRDM